METRRVTIGDLIVLSAVTALLVIAWVQWRWGR